jgi:signal transduction histidine kinase
MDWILGCGIYFQDIEAEVNNIEASFIKITAYIVPGSAYIHTVHICKKLSPRNMKNEAYTNCEVRSSISDALFTLCPKVWW